MAYDHGTGSATMTEKSIYAPIGGTPRDRNPDSFASVAEQANVQTGEFLRRLGALTDRLCGGTPPSAEMTGGQTLRGIPNGHFEEAADNCRGILLKLEEATRCLDRIERALP